MRRGRWLMGLAVALWIGAWARVVHTHLTSPSPARYLEFVDADGPVDPPSWPHCHGTRFVVGARVWQHCEEGPSAPAGYARFDLSSGLAELRWPLDGHRWRWARGFVPLPDGGAVLAAEDAALPSRGGTRLVRLRPEGGHEPLGSLAHDLLALRLEGDHLEAVTAFGPHLLARHRRPLKGGEWTADPLPAFPMPVLGPDNPYRHTAVDAASHGPEGWTLWAVKQGADGTTAELWRCPPGGAWALAARFPDGFRADVMRQTHLDRTPDGALSPYGGTDERNLYLARTGDTWAPLVERPPGVTERLLGGWPDLMLTPEGPRRLSRWPEVSGERIRVDDRWLGLVRRDGQVHAAAWRTEPAGPTPPDPSAPDPSAPDPSAPDPSAPDPSAPDPSAPDPSAPDPSAPAAAASTRPTSTPELVGPPLTRESWLASSPSFLPLADGGYTVLGTFGTYVRLGGHLARTDHLGLLGRLGAHFGHFRRFAWYNDRWLDFAPLKMATLPVVLLGLPLLLLLGLRPRRARSAAPDPAHASARANALAAAAAVWLLLAAAFGWHFWYFTGPRWF